MLEIALLAHDPRKFEKSRNQYYCLALIDDLGLTQWSDISAPMCFALQKNNRTNAASCFEEKAHL